MYGPKNASVSFSSNEPYPRHIPLHSHGAPSQMKSAMSPPASPTYHVHQPHRPRGYPALCLAERQPSYSAAQEGQFIWSPEQKLAGGEEHVETCPHQALF